MLQSPPVILPELQEQFLRAGNAYKAAQLLWPSHRTGYLTFMVVACESLKPRGRRYDGWNIYDVVQALTGTAKAEELRQLSCFPDTVDGIARHDMR